MGERPILMSAPMVRACLDGSKTQTRRVVKPQPERIPPDVQRVKGDTGWWWSCARVKSMVAMQDIRQFCPCGAPGDLLWVREAWAHDAETLEQCRAAHEDAMGGVGYGPYYRATEVAPETLRWRPSIHMPRWASRLTLRITDVRVERLQEISKRDVAAEGIIHRDGVPISEVVTGWHEPYAQLWESINGKGSWDANPWVWVVGFERVGVPHV